MEAIERERDRENSCGRERILFGFWAIYLALKLIFLIKFNFHFLFLFFCFCAKGLRERVWRKRERRKKDERESKASTERRETL